MATYTAGGNAQPSLQDIVINPNQIGTGDYILYYRVPLIAFRLLDPHTIDGVIRGWIDFRNADARPGDQTTEVRGVYINTDTGDVKIAVNVTLVPNATITDSHGRTVTVGPLEEAGVNYMRVLGTIAVLFGALGIILVLVSVYKVTENVVGGPVAAGTIGLILGTLIALFVFTYFFSKGRVAFT